MNAAVVIPARYASSRLEGKPLADICGRPMVQWVYERARAARLADYVAVATDDARIAKAVAAFNGNCVMTSINHASGTDRIAEAAQNIDADIIVNLQGDEPLIEPGSIDDALRPLIDDPGVTMSTLKTRITDMHEYNDPNIVKVVTDRDGYAVYFSRSPIPYERTPFKDAGAVPYKHIGLYVYRKEFLMRFPELKPTPLEKAECLEQLRALENGVRIKVVEIGYNPVSVDTPADLERVRNILKRQ